MSASFDTDVNPDVRKFRNSQVLLDGQREARAITRSVSRDNFRDPFALVATNYRTQLHRRHEIEMSSDRQRSHARSRAVTATLVLVVLCASACSGRTTAASGSIDATGTAARVADFVCPADAGAGQTVRPFDGNRLQVVTTVAPITSIVANIAGDRADVDGVIPEGIDSHTYEPKPSIAKEMSTADLDFVNGLMLDDPTREIAKTNLRDGAALVELGTSTIRPDQYIYDFSFPKDGGKPNPHLWTNPEMAKCYAAITVSAMQRSDPANASYYGANYVRYAAKLDVLDAAMRRATVTVPSANRKLLTYHDAYAYFSVHYGYRVVGAVQLSDFEEPTPKEVARLIEQVKSEKVPAIFGSEVFPSAVLAEIATESGTKFVDSLRDDDLPGAPGEADHSYLGLMRFDFATIVANLGGDASRLRSLDTSDVATDTANYAQ